MKENVLSELRKTFNPEFLNRIDEIVVFHPLDKGHLISIIDLLIEETNKQLIEQELVIEVAPEVKEWILDHYYKPAYGARPMRRAIQKVIEDPLSEEILKGRFKGANKIKVLLETDGPVFISVEEASLLTGVN
jgi:ATP-dependent Clp protease ATP-binding subunit ClpC